MYSWKECLQTLLLGLLLLTRISTSVTPNLSPFFFLCNYHGNSQNSGLNNREVIVSIHIEGNPQFYVPNEFYQVSISSSQVFDSFLMTGLYTALTEPPASMAVGEHAAQHWPRGIQGQNLMCSIVHSQVSPQPLRSLSFIWMAPPTGTGCVSFLATATYNQQLLFKDTTVLQLCELGAATEAVPLKMAEIHSPSVILRDDFDSDVGFNPEIWEIVEGSYIGDDCGSIVHGKSAVFCNVMGNRELVTVPLNLTSARVLQFTIGVGFCQPPDEADPAISVAFGLDNCTNWVEIEQISFPEPDNHEVHLVNLPPKSRFDGICLKFSQSFHAISHTPVLQTTSKGPWQRGNSKFSQFTQNHQSVTMADTTTTSPRHTIPSQPIMSQRLSTSSVPITSSKPTTSAKSLASSKTITSSEPIISSELIASSEPITSSNPTTSSKPVEPEGDIGNETMEHRKNVMSENSSSLISLENMNMYNLPENEMSNSRQPENNPQFWGIPNDEPYLDEPIKETFYNGCWAIDNVVVINTANPPEHMMDSFDPINPTNWIFFPGAVIKSHCHSLGDALVFDEEKKSVTFAVTRDLDISTKNSSADALLFDDFDNKRSSNLEGNGRIGLSCGTVHQGNSLIFDGVSKRQVCSEMFDPKSISSVQFYFKYGQGDCHSSDTSPPVLIYLENEEEHSTVLKVLQGNEYSRPHLISIPFTKRIQEELKGQVRFCLLQKSHHGLGKDVWAIDHLALLPFMPKESKEDKDSVFQASLNLQCNTDLGESTSHDNLKINIEYSKDHGDIWQDLYPDFVGYDSLTSKFYAYNHFGWNRIVLPLPYDAQKPSVRFRIQGFGNSSTNWAIDEVFIGQCKDWCHGHGSCTENGCQCDFGYEGETCDKPVVPVATNLFENFEDPNLVGNSGLLDISGASIGYECGVLSSGKSIIFNGGGQRSITTTEFDTTNISTIRFTLRVGSLAAISNCPPPEADWPGIVLEFSCNGGITWSLLEKIKHGNYKNPKSISLMLPDSSRSISCQFRWRQLERSPMGKDVWAIDDIALSDSHFNSLSLEMMDMPVIQDLMTSTDAKLMDSFCDRMRSLVFSSPEKDVEGRFVMTDALHIGPGYVAEFDLVMGCGVPYTKGIDNNVYFQYSSDHGISWHLVQRPCLPPDICDEHTSGSFYHPSKFGQWTTLAVVLPEALWGQEVKFQWLQLEWEESDVWAINRINIGHACADLCHGHGSCHNGVCRCFSGYEGEKCDPEYQLDSTIHADFGPRYKPDFDFNFVGGSVKQPNEGCGTVLSGGSLHFDQDGVRELISKELDTSQDDFIQFYIRIGGEEGSECNGGERREESVLLQYSVNNGTHWETLKELHHLEYRRPSFVHIKIPPHAKTHYTRFRWWQPALGVDGTDQWAVDEILIGHYKNNTTINDDFNNAFDVLGSDQWRFVTEGSTGKFCQSTHPSLVMANQLNDKFVVSNDVFLSPADVIQFEINVDCGKVFRWDHPVIFQYSHDQGQTWNLVEEPCYLDQECGGDYTEGSIYYTGTHGKWTLVVLPVTEKIARHPTIFRWWQQGGLEHSFSLDNVYIGPPCPGHCKRRGLCIEGQCVCTQNLNDIKNDYQCALKEGLPSHLWDNFDNRNMPSMLWGSVLGGLLGKGCGVIDAKNSLYFRGEGTREVVTVPLDTRQKRILQFSYKIGDETNTMMCQWPRHQNEGLLVDYSTDNGITWHNLRVLEPNFNRIVPQEVIIELPQEARAHDVLFRFWQPLGLGGMPRAQWAIDSVLIGINATSGHGFEDQFSGMMPNPHHWFLADSAVQRPSCDSKGNVLEFSGKGQRLAETWDYDVNPSTFLQFDLAMECGSLAHDLYDIKLEYSTNLGHSWFPVIDECLPPHFECQGYHVSSNYISDQHSNWTRVTVALPEEAISPATRFRWIQPSNKTHGTIWALDNIYIGDGCPWLCSGHGVCHSGKCICDPGYAGEFCVPERPLPMMLRDNFNKQDVDSSIWNEVTGGENTWKCGTVVSGRGLTFHKNTPRVAVTHDMDSSMLLNMEFYFKFGCGQLDNDWPRDQSVILQYSTNGGISWKLIKEIHFSKTPNAKFYSIPLPLYARHNATRFRFWQPKHKGEMKSVWSVDNLIIGGTAMNPAILLDSFDSEQVDRTAWPFVNNGHVDEYCAFSTRPSTLSSGQSSLVFRRMGQGEISAVTTDLELGPMSVLQFDINVGCGAEPTANYPVRLEYSTDGGLSWSLVGPNCGELFGGRCFESGVPMTVYYAGESLYWHRVAMPLDHIQTCGPIRFRWYQGNVPESAYAPEWAIDNVYIGMACLDHCNGHGTCIGGIACECDEGYAGLTCVSIRENPPYLRDGFDLKEPRIPKIISSPSDSPNGIDESKWELWSGGRVVKDHLCGPIFDAAFFLHDKEGQRILATVPLDLSEAFSIQFHLKRGCGQSVSSSLPLYLQYSVNGGMLWTTVERFDFNNGTRKDIYIALHIPEQARTNSTQIRWWMPSANGRYPVDWAIDQIFIGGNYNGQRMLQDEPSAPSKLSWLEYPGAVVKSHCNSDGLVIHFKGWCLPYSPKEKYVSTADVSVGDGSHLQFALSMGCPEDELASKQLCFEMKVEYSTNLGKTWHILLPPCLPSESRCIDPSLGTVYSSDAHTGWHRITVPIPKEAWSTQTRFRLHQDPSLPTETSWSVAKLYVGSSCPDLCSGHGHCMDGACVCDTKWDGGICNTPISQLTDLLVEDFDREDDSLEDKWMARHGGEAVYPCQVMSAGKAFHMTGSCSRILETVDLDLHSAVYIQFYFMFGCKSMPTNRAEGVFLYYSSNGGVTWQLLKEMHYNAYRIPVFVHLQLPVSAQRYGVRFKWHQLKPNGNDQADWLIDAIRIGGQNVNPHVIQSTGQFNFTFVTAANNIEIGDNCGKEDVVIGTTKAQEGSAFEVGEVNVTSSHLLQFSVNAGCGQPWNASLSPVELKYSTDHGVTWTQILINCYENEMCRQQDYVDGSHYHGLHDNWRKFTVIAPKLAQSPNTRFRWEQSPRSGKPHQTWAIGDIYVGPACPGYCSGQGQCSEHGCICDEGHEGDDCSVLNGTHHLTDLKDSFDHLNFVNRSRFSWVQGGNTQIPCKPLVDGPALVFSGPGARELVTQQLDLRGARFIQYITFMWSSPMFAKLCKLPPKVRGQDILLQYSTNNGIQWKTLHVLSPDRYWPKRRDYISLPKQSRQSHAVIRWIQREPTEEKEPRVNWAIDNVYIGGKEINPSSYSQTFPDMEVNDDPGAWEFSPRGKVKGSEDECLQAGEQGHAMVWKSSGLDSDEDEEHKFTTNQMIVQRGHMIQFKINIGCGNILDECAVSAEEIRLEFRRNPHSDSWEPVKPVCLPGHQKSGMCNPLQHHQASRYTISEYPSWRRVTILLPSSTFSGSTQFRWIPSHSNHSVSWALDDILVSEQCEGMCSGRGDCVDGQCMCDDGYYGPQCMPQRFKLRKRLFESFEGGIFSSTWEMVTGGGIGFGCGALLPYAHGKSLYFNGCGERQAITAELDTSHAIKIIFAIQIGCYAQTEDCNVQLDDERRYRGVLLQYSKNKGAEWYLIAQHDPTDFLRPKRVAYDIPRSAKGVGTQFRWWQPIHGGIGFDQWAIDHVEIISGRRHFRRGRGRWRG